MNPSVAVVIPTHKGRSENMFLEAIRSVDRQVHRVAELCVAYDYLKQGSAATRQRALDMAHSEWVSFLDSDDMLYPNHIQDLLRFAQETGSDYVWSYWDRKKTPDFLGHFGRKFDPQNPHLSTITVLVKREIAQEARFVNHPNSNKIWSGDDWSFQLRCLELGATMNHLAKETWFYRHHGGNTSGVPTKGDAR